MKETYLSSEICEKNWWIRYRLHMRGCVCESCKREASVGKQMFTRGKGRGKEGSQLPRRTPACTYLSRRGRGRLIIVCGVPRPTAWRGNNSASHKHMTRWKRTRWVLSFCFQGVCVCVGGGGHSKRETNTTLVYVFARSAVNLNVCPPTKKMPTWEWEKVFWSGFCILFRTSILC